MFNKAESWPLFKMLRHADLDFGSFFSVVAADGLRLGLHGGPGSGAAGEIDGVAQGDPRTERDFNFGVFALVLEQVQVVVEVIRDAAAANPVRLAWRAAGDGGIGLGNAVGDFDVHMMLAGVGPTDAVAGSVNIRIGGRAGGIVLGVIHNGGEVNFFAHDGLAIATNHPHVDGATHDAVQDKVS